MEPSIHRFRNNEKAIAAGNPAWQEAYDRHLINLCVRYAGNDRFAVHESGFQFVNLSSCSYLGLHEHPALLEGAIDGLRRENAIDVPISRIRMRLPLTDELEEHLSTLFRARCLSAATASSATCGVLPLIASGHLSDGKPPVMVFDRYCHFSMNLIKPICADETEVLTSPHNDLNYIEDLCKKHPRVAYVADGAYSLGGTAPVEGLIDLQDRYGLFLFFDDSHSLSACGTRGEGYVRSKMGEELNPLTVIVVSLGKGFGASGGAIMLGPAEHADVVIRFGGPLAWSQKLNTAGLGAAIASAKIHATPELTALQKKLHDNLALFDSLLPTEQTGEPFSIRMVTIGDEKRASRVSEQIFERGFYTSPVFFPIVEKGKAGLRVMLRADNRPEDIRTFVDAVKELSALD